MIELRIGFSISKTNLKLTYIMFFDEIWRGDNFASYVRDDVITQLHHNVI